MHSSANPYKHTQRNHHSRLSNMLNQPDENRMAGCAVEPSLITYNAVISNSRKSKRWARILVLLDCMDRQSLGHDVITYNAAISSLEVWTRVLGLFARLREGGIEASEVTCNAVSSSCEKSLRWEGSLDVLAEMRRGGLALGAISCNVATSACEKGRQWERAVRLLVADELGCSAATSACEKGSQWSSALELLAWAGRAGVRRALPAYNAAASACESAREWRGSLGLLTATALGGAAPDVVSFGAALAACAARGEPWRRCGALLARMRRAGLRADLLGCKCAAAACGRGSNWPAAVALLGRFAPPHAGRGEAAALWGVVASACELGSAAAPPLPKWGGWSRN